MNLLYIQDRKREKKYICSRRRNLISNTRTGKKRYKRPCKIGWHRNKIGIIRCILMHWSFKPYTGLLRHTLLNILVNYYMKMISDFNPRFIHFIFSLWLQYANYLYLIKNGTKGTSVISNCEWITKQTPITPKDGRGAFNTFQRHSAQPISFIQKPFIVMTYASSSKYNTLT